MYNSGDLLCVQAGLLLQPETDREQVRHDPPHPHTNRQPSTHTCTPFNLHLFTFMCSVFCSYKVPAKGDGVDYVRTEDEVCTWMLEGSLNVYMSLQRNTCQQ